MGIMIPPQLNVISTQDEATPQIWCLHHHYKPERIEFRGGSECDYKTCCGSEFATNNLTTKEITSQRNTLIISS